MVTAKRWVIINISLGFVSFLLLLNLFGVSMPSLGQAATVFDPSDPICAVEWQGDISIVEDLDRCCLAARMQLSCELIEGEFDRTCGGEGNTLRYLFNEKGYRYCERQVFWD